MKKLFSLLIAVGFVIGMTASGAWAANGDLVVAASTDIPAEAAATMQADETGADNDDGVAGTTVVANDATTGIQYTLGTSYVNNDTITFTLSAGKWQEATYYLATIDDLDPTDNDDTLTPSPLGKTPFAQISKTDTVITFRVTDDTAQIMADDGSGGDGIAQSAVIAGVTYYLVQLSDPDTATAGTLDVAADGQTANPTIDASSLASPGTITVTVESQTSTGLPLDNAGDKTEDLVKSFTQFTALIDGTDTGSNSKVADGIIDVNNGRVQFTVADALVTTDTVVISLVSDADAEISTEQITTDASDSFVFTFSGDMSSVDSFGYDVNGDGDLLDGNDIVGTIDTTTSPNTATVTLTGAQLINAGGTIGDVVAGAEEEDAPFVFIVDGTVLAVRSFTVQVAMSLADENVDKDLLAAGTAAGSWGINGYQAKIPYMLAKTDKHTVLRLVNQGNLLSDVTIDLMGPNGETATAEYIGAAGVPANGSKFFTALDIMDDATGWTGGDIYTATVTMTVSNEDGLIEAYVWSDLGYRPTTTYDTRGVAANAAGTGFSK